jgi:hypothetical protein
MVPVTAGAEAAAPALLDAPADGAAADGAATDGAAADGAAADGAVGCPLFEHAPTSSAALKTSAPRRFVVDILDDPPRCRALTARSVAWAGAR